MKPAFDSSLTNSILEEGLDAFRAQLLARSVRTAKLWHRVRVGARTLSGLTILAIVFGIVNRQTPSSPSMVSGLSPSSRPPTRMLIQSTPLPAGILVRRSEVPSSLIIMTSALEAGVLVRGDDFSTIPSPGEVILKTDSQVKISRLDDDQLLASFGSRPAALLRPPGEPPRLLLVGTNPGTSLHNRGRN
ncbi:MAG: hypothetical protein ACR2OZ_05035 [Verrucomicrobiales bacterium]